MSKVSGIQYVGFAACVTLQKNDPGGSMVSLREGISMCLNEWPINNNPDGFAGAREKGLGLLMKSAGKNSFYSFCGQNCKNPFLYFFCGPAEKEIPCGRAGQLPAAAAAGNGYASERCSIPQSVLRQALRGRFSASAGGYPAVPVRCSIPRCTRSDSGAGGGRPADAAQEVVFPVPASLASNNSAGASERSACQPRQRLAKGDAASIRRSIPLSQEGVMRPGGYTGDPKFHVVDYAPVANGVKTIADGRKNKKWTKIHRSRPCIFRKKSGRIIARKFGIINKIFCGSHGTEGRPGQIGGLHSHGSEAVCNRGIISHGKIGAKILLISGGVIR